jgi:radical S-adenosyl methionine domain-containing protein 2
MTIHFRIEKAEVKSVNWHITGRCNYHCKFCFSQQLDEEVTSLERADVILRHVRKMGMEKINFVGGEPTLHPLFIDYIKLAKGMGFVVSFVTNGSQLNEDTIKKLKPFVDWIGLSIDSADETVEKALGRGNGCHVQQIFNLAQIIHEAGIKLKINTTVTRLNWTEDVRPLIQKLKPLRWKVFQVLHIEGQNDEHFDELSITDAQFRYFKTLNGEPIEGITTVFEGNHEMLASYFMLSPGGKVISNKDGANRTFTPLEGITNDNISQVLDVQQYVRRGGIYPWQFSVCPFLKGGEKNG